MQYFSVKNWDKFQHYKDRSPPWIKLHRDLLHDYDFSCLQDASKMQLMMIWLLASQMDNKIPADPEWLKNALHIDSKPDLKALSDAGFIDIDSDVLADCKQHAMPETETETETETEKHISDNSNELPPVDRCPIKKIVNLYHEKLPDLPRVEKITKAREGYIKQRWREDLKTIDAWENFFDFVGQSDFLMGKVNGYDDRKPFIASLEWLTRPGNFAKIAEEKYHG